jgi:hypothetical protein
VLDNIRVAAPCSASWDAMIGDDRVRACGDCQKNVYNLSDMTRDEAETLIREKEGRLCVRYFQRADGTILLKDCVVGVKRRRRRRVVAAGVAASLAGAAFGYTRTRAGAAKLPRDYQLMGEVASELPPIVEPPTPAFPEPRTPAFALDRMVQGAVVLSPDPVEIRGKLSLDPAPTRDAPTAKQARRKPGTR